MRIVLGVLILLPEPHLNWTADWLWGLPLIVGTVLIHVFGLGAIRHRTARFSNRSVERRHPTIAFGLIMAATTLLASCLHAIEAAIWGAAYRLLGALPDNKSAMLYSLDAITSYGHTTLTLQPHWHLMGALEALNGWLLFGLTTAFMFGMLENVWKADGGARS
jgi:hypothetical protein